MSSSTAIVASPESSKDVRHSAADKRALSPLFSEGWLEFSREYWGVRPERIKFSLDRGDCPGVEAVLLLDRKGKIVCPRTVPYLPISYFPEPGATSYGQYRDYLEVMGKLAKEMCLRGITHVLSFPPEISDLRPWQWAGLVAEVRYTFHYDLPFDASRIYQSTRRNIKATKKKGFTCDRAEKIEHVYQCLAQAQERQGFNYQISADGLRRAQSLMGPEACRTYVCYSPAGEPVATLIALSAPGARALFWLAGMGRTDSANYGFNEVLYEFVLEDLCRTGASGIDFVGANIPRVAAAKARWGGYLVPFYVVEPRTRNLLRHWRDAFRSHRICAGR
jgi:hypothetical protein